MFHGHPDMHSKKKKDKKTSITITKLKFESLEQLELKKEQCYSTRHNLTTKLHDYVCGITLFVQIKF